MNVQDDVTFFEKWGLSKISDLLLPMIFVLFFGWVVADGVLGVLVLCGFDVITPYEVFVNVRP